MYSSSKMTFDLIFLKVLTYATMTLLTVKEYLWHKWPWICSVYRKHTLLITELVARSTRRVPHVEQERLTLLQLLSLPPFFTCSNRVRVVFLCAKLHLFTLLDPCYFLCKNDVRFVFTPFCFVGRSCLICLYLFTHNGVEQDFDAR
jgi:hypothetical protein